MKSTVPSVAPDGFNLLMVGLLPHRNRDKSRLSARPCFDATDVRRSFVDNSRHEWQERSVLSTRFAEGRYTLEGAITGVHRDQARTWRQDPGRPVPPKITRITGLSGQDLAGQAIDVAAVAELIAGAHLVIAHIEDFFGSVDWLPMMTATACWLGNCACAGIGDRLTG